jgi:hypothetical protein
MEMRLLRQGENAGDERALGVGVRLPVVAKAPGEGGLEGRVLGGEGAVGAQAVAEREPLVL